MQISFPPFSSHLTQLKKKILNWELKVTDGTLKTEERHKTQISTEHLPNAKQYTRY